MRSLCFLPRVNIFLARLHHRLARRFHLLLQMCDVLQLLKKTFVHKINHNNAYFHSTISQFLAFCLRRNVYISLKLLGDDFVLIRQTRMLVKRLPERLHVAVRLLRLLLLLRLVLFHKRSAKKRSCAFHT